jgi:DNA modification methylase
VTPYYADDWLTVYLGDCRAVMAELPAESVHCVVTSPPYWGLRDYGTATWVGGDEGCDHLAGPLASDKNTLGGGRGQVGPGYKVQEFGTPFKGDCRKCGAIRQDGQLGLEPTPEQYVENMVAVFREVRRVLRSDGTVWLNLGDSYNTSPPGNKPNTTALSSGLPNSIANQEMRRSAQAGIDKTRATGLKPKDLVGIPWRVAFALQADGWYLRSDIIWSKPNPMPESVTDRPTKSHEYLFLLAKGQWKSAVIELTDSDGKRRHLGQDGRFQGQHLWANEVAVRLATAVLDSPQLQQDLGLPPLHPQVGQEGAHGFYGDLVRRLPVEHRAAVGAARLLAADSTPEQFLRELHGLGVTLADRHNLLIGGIAAPLALPPGIYGYGQTSVAVDYPGEIREFDFVHGNIITATPTTCTYYFDADAVREDGAGRMDVGQMTSPARLGQGGPWTATEKPEAGRNIRSVWNIATQPYPGAHFATFPPKLVEPCIKAGTSEKGVCPECGAPWERVVELDVEFTSGSGKAGNPPSGKNGSQYEQATSGTYDIRMGPAPRSVTTGWRPTCVHYERATEWPDLPVRQQGEKAEDYERRIEPLVVLRLELLALFRPLVATMPVVLDPFAGSGTTGMVAQSFSRRAVLIDLSAEYLRQLMDRNRDMPLGLGA